MRLFKIFTLISGFFLLFSSAFLAQQNSSGEHFTHQDHMLKNFQKIDTNFYPKRLPKSNWLKKIPAPRAEYEIFGWYPNWDHSYYLSMNYDLMNTIAFFNTSINANNGSLNSGSGSYDWPNHPVIKMTRDKGKRLLLTATCFGGSSIHTLLSNTTSTNNLVTNLVNSNKAGNGNGICLDFEGMYASDKTNFSNFVSSLKKALLNQNAGNKLYVALPAVDWHDIFDFTSLIQNVDRFVIMGYDYYYSGSTVAGPNSPKESGNVWYGKDLTNSVNYYLNKGVPNNQLMLALPFYGRWWETKSGSIGAAASSSGNTFSYKQIASLGYPQLVENYSKSTYHILPLGSTYKQYWYEADSSFQDKLDLVTSKKLAGMGIWALGYESPYTDLWVTIMQSLSSDRNYFNLLKRIPKDSILIDSLLRHPVNPIDTTVVNPDSTNVKKIIQTLEKNLEEVIDYQAVLLVTLSWLCLFGGFGILLAILYPDTRNYFFSTASIRNMWVLFVLVTLVIILFMKGTLNLESVSFIIAFTLGAITFYLINKYVQNRRKNLP